MTDSSDDWLFYAENPVVICALLEAFPGVREVSLDISDLIAGGFVEPGARICDEGRDPDRQWRSILQPAVVIAEGSTDITVLKRSLQSLYPYLTDYFAFFDHNDLSVDGGASDLVKFVRAFAAARINTGIIAIFDNDSAGLEALNSLARLSLPSNIRVTRLPDIELARRYPTIGPQGEHELDMNGKAASIELYLGRHNFTNDDGTLMPVVWGSYLSGIGQYQGEIRNKKSILARFLKETDREGSVGVYRARHPELVALWERIFSVGRQLSEHLIGARNQASGM